MAITTGAQQPSFKAGVELVTIPERQSSGWTRVKEIDAVALRPCAIISCSRSSRLGKSMVGPDPFAATIDIACVKICPADRFRIPTYPSGPPPGDPRSFRS